MAIISVDATNGVLPSDGHHSVGIHPAHADLDALDIDTLTTLVNHPKVVAIGETGLDKLALPPFHQQEEIFIHHIKLAEKERKPLIIHCVKACQEMIAIRKRYKNDVPWIIHGFRGNSEYANQFLHAGFYLSFGMHYHPESLQAAWKAGRLFAETDDEDISIEDVYQRITSHLSITGEALSQQIRENIQAWPNPVS